MSSFTKLVLNSYNLAKLVHKEIFHTRKQYPDIRIKSVLVNFLGELSTLNFLPSIYEHYSKV